DRGVVHRSGCWTTAAPWSLHQRNLPGPRSRGAFIPDDREANLPQPISAFLPRRAELRRRIRAELGLPDDALVAITVGQLHRRKRLRDALWAADLLKVVRSDVHVLVVGEGPDREGLERFRRQVHIEDRVHFLGVRPDVPELLLASDWFWSTSEREDVPWALCEAQQLGIPVVATDIPAHRVFVAHGQSGLLFPLGDRAGPARATFGLLEDPSAVGPIIETARTLYHHREDIARQSAENMGLRTRSVATLYAECRPVRR
ncbi:MAG TPA: glycosyltransferase, partial [Pirellulaceae bacterium]